MAGVQIAVYERSLSLKFYVLTAKFAEKFDVIFCLNVLSLTTGRNREIALGNLWQHLSQDGYLILGHNENFGLVVPACNQESRHIAKKN